tara:strand:+ start:304 stop:2034 length:1731 start_codon:yes stop_codon:yes gene_type:complete
MNTDILFARRWPKSSLSQDIAQIDIASYFQAYQDLKRLAPKRAHGRPYLGGRFGYPSTEGKTNRREEHFAIALVNAQQVWCLPDGTKFELLDYQVPLKATRADRKIGKIDIFGLTEHGRAVLVELKVIGHSGGPSDPPPVALLEGLRYASIVEANLHRIAEEVRDTYGREMLLERPDIMVLGEADWWSRWLHAGTEAKTALEEKTGEISQAIGINIVFASVTNTRVDYGQRTKAPRLIEFPKLEYQHPVPKSAMNVPSDRNRAPVEHEAQLQRTWWSYAKTLPEKDLDGRDRPGRPPVVSVKRPSANLMLPPDRKMASEIGAQIAETDRHKYFRSFRSSQALAQSVFGAFKAAGRIELLSQVPAECGRRAFGNTMPGTTLSMEVDVRTLKEPRPTQLDVCLETDDYRVAIECKFCEPEFGTCSRVRSDKCKIPICDGTYTHQQGRQTRCALSELGISYWEFIPELFDWDAARDLSPCPLLPTYQIVRNVLASVVDRDGHMNPSNGHAIFVYDSRNPAYKINGAADAQLRRTALACRVPGLIRRVSWQQIVRVCVGSSDLAWLLQAIEEKHGICLGP